MCRQLGSMGRWTGKLKVKCSKGSDQSWRECWVRSSIFGEKLGWQLGGRVGEK